MWETVKVTGDPNVYVLPLSDVVAHEDSDSCVCGPTTEPVQREDGSFGWLVTHHALDGREQGERY